MKKKSDPDPLVRGPDPGIWIRIRTKMSRIPNTAVHISENPNTISDGCQDRRNKSLLLFCALNYGREQIESSQKTKHEKRLGDGTEGNITWWFYGWRPVMDGWGGRRTGSLVSASRFLTRNWAKTSPTYKKLSSYLRSTEGKVSDPNIKIWALNCQRDQNWNQCCGSGSEFFSQRYGSFHHQAKILRKPWFLLFSDFFMAFYLCKMTYLWKVIIQKM